MAESHDAEAELIKAFGRTYDAPDGEGWRLVPMSDDGAVVPTGIPDALSAAVAAEFLSNWQPDADNGSSAVVVALADALNEVLREHGESAADVRCNCAAHQRARRVLSENAPQIAAARKDKPGH